MNHFTSKVLWIYIILLFAGTTLRGIFQTAFALELANVILVALLLVFTVRLGKTRKFLPSG